MPSQSRKKKQKAKSGWQTVFCCDLNERQVSNSMTHHILERKCACNGACNQCSLHGTNIFFDQNPILHSNSKYFFVGITMVQFFFVFHQKNMSPSYRVQPITPPKIQNVRCLTTKGSFASLHFRAKNKKRIPQMDGNN